MAFVFSVNTRSILETSIVHVPSSTSTNTGVAPHWEIASVVAMKVLGTVITSSFGPTPHATSARCSAVVPELAPIPYFALQ